MGAIVAKWWGPLAKMVVEKEGCVARGVHLFLNPPALAKGLSQNPHKNGTLCPILYDALTLHPLFILTQTPNPNLNRCSACWEFPAPPVLSRQRRCPSAEGGERGMVEGVVAEAPKHRDFGSHRFGQDDTNGAGTLLHG